MSVSGLSPRHIPCALVLLLAVKLLLFYRFFVCLFVLVLVNRLLLEKGIYSEMRTCLNVVFYIKLFIFIVPF